MNQATLHHIDRPKGRRVTPADRKALADLLAALLAPGGAGEMRRERLIEYLHVIQDARGHLPIALLAALAEALKISQAEVYEVASFYHHFDVVEEKPASVTVRICTTGACALAGGATLAAKLQNLLGADVRVVEAPCIGRCEKAPAALIGGEALGLVTPERVSQALAGTLSLPETNAEPMLLDAYAAQGGYQLLRECGEGKHDSDSVIATLEQSGLRGLGGAGFPTGRKWRIVRSQPGPRLMAVNIDEGEPGTFKDRHYLEREPHRFLEGMLIAAWAVGIEAIYIYLRDEYAECRRILAAALAELAGQHILPQALPRIELRRGAGAYVCGEESAMIESIEGKRGMPRLRPPYVAEVGLFDRPTLVQNCETLFWVPAILKDGGASFINQGRHGRKGLRSFSVSGRVRQPGVKLAPAGITLRELIDEYCGGMIEGHELYAYLPGGASGGILPARLADVPLDFDTLQPYGCFIGSASVIVLSKQDSARDTALRMMKFFAAESCGQCTPCRIGTHQAARLMAARRWDEPLLRDLAQAMTGASICGLGQAAPNVLLCVLKYFPDEVGASDPGTDVAGRSVSASGATATA
ncbi:MAG: NAD(P)H-dependent oxidoreductase subunit E [Betaproteobacteria bacterium]|nr:NAD(P)H-dependent oxidoreductase subunit E [Betaproteobacteria bacterium]